jgi:hypothetical protein
MALAETKAAQSVSSAESLQRLLDKAEGEDDEDVIPIQGPADDPVPV